MSSIVDRFFAHLNKDRMAYGRRMMTTLEANKIERHHQQPTESCIFRRKIDQFGVIESIEVNMIYVDHVPAPRTDFTEQEVTDFLAQLELVDHDRLYAFLMVGVTEHALQATAPAGAFGGPPFIFKQYDEQGFPVAYRFNVPLGRTLGSGLAESS